MPVVLRDVPPGYHWGWYSREEPRMHLQTVDQRHLNHHKVWLERQGKRVFDPVAAIPSKTLKRLEAEVERHRRDIEDRWVNFMIRNQWLQLFLSGASVVVAVYPGTPNKFTRTLDLRQFLRAEEVARLKPEDVRLNPLLPTIEFWPRLPEEDRHDVQLATVLWED